MRSVSEKWPLEPGLNSVSWVRETDLLGGRNSVHRDTGRRRALTWSLNVVARSGQQGRPAVWVRVTSQEKRQAGPTCL